MKYREGGGNALMKRSVRSVIQSDAAKLKTSVAPYVREDHLENTYPPLFSRLAI